MGLRGCSWVFGVGGQGRAGAGAGRHRQAARLWVAHGVLEPAAALPLLPAHAALGPHLLPAAQRTRRRRRTGAGMRSGSATSGRKKSSSSGCGSGTRWAGARLLHWARAHAGVFGPLRAAVCPRCAGVRLQTRAAPTCPTAQRLAASQHPSNPAALPACPLLLPRRRPRRASWRSGASRKRSLRIWSGGGGRRRRRTARAWCRRCGGCLLQPVLQPVQRCGSQGVLEWGAANH